MLNKRMVNNNNNDAVTHTGSFGKMSIAIAKFLTNAK